MNKQWKDEVGRPQLVGQPVGRIVVVGSSSTWFVFGKCCNQRNSRGSKLTVGFPYCGIR